MESSDNETEKCSFCSKDIEDSDYEHEYFCKECANMDITIWECLRCGNCYSPDYSDERIYSDCCMGMAEHSYEYGYSIDDIKYCEISGDTIYPGDTNCRYCNDHSDSSNDSSNDKECKQLIAYKEGLCKLKDF